MIAFIELHATPSSWLEALEVMPCIPDTTSKEFD